MHLQTTVKHPIPKRVKAWPAHLCLKKRRKLLNRFAVYVPVSSFYRQAALISWYLRVDAYFSVCVFRCMVSCLHYLPCLFFMTDLHCRHFCGFDGQNELIFIVFSQSPPSSTCFKQDSEFIFSDLASTPGKSGSISNLGLYLGCRVCYELMYQPVYRNWV